ETVGSGSTTKIKNAEQASPQVDLAAFVALSVDQKQLYLKGLEADARFASVLPALRAVLTAEIAQTQSTQHVAAPAQNSPAPLKGLTAENISILLSQLGSKGQGPAAYWKRTTQDIVYVANAFAPLVRALAAAQKGSVSVSLQALSQSLGNLSSKGR